MALSAQHAQALRERPAAKPLRLAPNLFIAHTQPGFESILWSEIADRIPAAREVTRRVAPGRAGMVICTAPHSEPLAELRTAEDIFAVVGYRHGFGAGKGALAQIRAAARQAPFVAQALQTRVRMLPGSRAGRRLTFRVVARLAGEHEFRRVDFERAIVLGIEERQDRRWRLVDDDAQVEFWATMIADELLVAIRLSDDKMRQRDYKIVHRPGSLRPAVAAALARLSEPRDDDVFLDPLCGTGTVLIERAHVGRYKMLLGGDRDIEALAAARENVGRRYKPIELRSWDATALPLADASVTRIVTNLPWGEKSGTHAENRRNYPKLIAEFRRVLVPRGIMVLLTAETGIMRELTMRGQIRPSRIFNVTILGASAAVYVCPS